MHRGYQKYDVVLVDFGNAEFHGEQGGQRPSVIVQNAMGNVFSTTTIVIPMTTQIKHLSQPTHSLVKADDMNGLYSNSMLLGECLRQVSEERIIKKIGTVTKENERNEVKRVYHANWGED